MRSSEFHPEAQDEFLTSIRFYRTESAELSRRFASAVRRTLELAADDAAADDQLQPGIYRRRVVRFPFDIVYRISDRELFVLAVAHHHRRPDYWCDRI